MRYTVVLEQTPNNWSAYVPDISGCISTGKTREEVERNIREALALHFEALHADNAPIPAPGTWTTVVDVPLPEGVVVGAEASVGVQVPLASHPQ